MIKVLCLAAPPYAGKDTVANHIFSIGENTIKHVKFARILKERTHAMYGLNVPWDHYEGKIKDQPLTEFLGISPRQAYINLSERLMKPVHGESVWFDLLMNEIRNSGCKNFVISDLGFQAEWENLIKQDDLIVGFVKIVRDGHDYSNDSRGEIAVFTEDRDEYYVEEMTDRYWTVSNNGTIDELYENSEDIAKQFFLDN